MKTTVFAMPGNERLGRDLAQGLGAEFGSATIRSFPDGETYVRIDSEATGRRAVLVCTLDRPDSKILPLLFLADAARDLGAAEVGLVAPYLPYMRQDRRFHPGEEVSSRYFARLISTSMDWLITVDPHLHRFKSLEQLFSIPARVVHAEPWIADWIRRQVARPLVIGPDSESGQWVRDIAERIGAPHVVLEKVRHGDRQVQITLTIDDHLRNHTPILVDDIISTARTMIQAMTQLKAIGFEKPICVGIHAIFAPGAYEELQAAGADRIVTCNCVPHISNGIDVTATILAELNATLACKETTPN